MHSSIFTYIIVDSLSQPFAKQANRHTRLSTAVMAMAKFQEKMKDKTREELVEICFQALLEVKVAREGELIGPTPASATGSFKKKLENKPREEIVTLCFDALKERQQLQKEASRGGQTGQRKRKVPEAEEAEDKLTKLDEKLMQT